MLVTFRLFFPIMWNIRVIFISVFALFSLLFFTGLRRTLFTFPFCFPFSLQGGIFFMASHTKVLFYEFGILFRNLYAVSMIPGTPNQKFQVTQLKSLLAFLYHSSQASQAIINLDESEDLQMQ